MTTTTQEKKVQPIHNRIRPSIYLSEPLQKANEQRGKRSLSARLAQIAERYELLCEDCNPAMEDDQLYILADALAGCRSITPLFIRYMDQELMLMTGNPETMRPVANRVAKLSFAERVALVESLKF